MWLAYHAGPGSWEFFTPAPVMTATCGIFVFFMCLSFLPLAVTLRFRAGDGRLERERQVERERWYAEQKAKKIEGGDAIAI